MDMKNTCKLLIITDTYVGIPGGSERHLYNFLSGLSDNFKVDVFQLIPTGNPMLEDGEFRGRSNILLNSHPLSRVLSFNFVRLLYKLVFKIWSGDINVVISYHEKSDITNFVIKMLFSQRVISISSKRDLGLKLVGRLRKVIKYITPKFDAITAPSNSIKNWLIKDFGLDEKTIHVIKNGVDLSGYSAITYKETQEIKKDLNISPTSKFMTSVACLKPVKGHKFLLQAFSAFKKQSKDDWCLLLIGDGELRQTLEHQVDLLQIKESVIFLGYQDNIPDWLMVSDLMVTATLSEGLSNALIEGCAAGCPIIATNVGGNPEIITDGFNGLLVEPENPQKMAELIMSLSVSTDLCKTMSVNSRNKALLEFSNLNMVDSLEALYISYMNEKVKT
jgi:glycosyltransferase involved in cell wall biosynthesis